MKIIEAMKKLKDLAAKATDLRMKIGQYCSDLSIETPTYPDQRLRVSEWQQSHHDVLTEIERLREAIQRTNLATMVTIDIGGRSVTKSIARWIHRRRDLAKLEESAWRQLGDRGLKESNVQTSPGGTVTEVRIRRYFDPQERDRKIDLYRSEPSIIDGTLEVTNAITDLIEE